MAQPMIVPVAKAIYLCDGSIGFATQKTDLMGLFNSIRPPSYPHTHTTLVVFAQLNGGLGEMPFYVDIRYAPTDELLFTTKPQMLRFPNRNRVVQFAYSIKQCRFPQRGMYLVELFSRGIWVADTTLELL